MIGSKPLNDKEVKMMLDSFTSQRNKCLFLLGCKTGFRISELLSITVQDVVQYGKIKDSVTVKRASMKGKHNSRTVVLHDKAKAALEAMGVITMQPQDSLFPIKRAQAHRIIKKAVADARIEGKVSSHSMRKTLAKNVFEALGRDLINTQRALGHKSINSTVSYLSFDQGAIDNAIKGI
jgi:integrase